MKKGGFMVEKLEKFWLPIIIGLWAEILANLATGILVFIKFFNTFVWIEAFTNVLIAVVLLIWLGRLHKVLAYDTAMAENYALLNFGSDEASQEGLALQSSLKARERNEKYYKMSSEPKKPLSDWPAFAGIDHPALDPVGYIEALINNGLCDEAEKRLNEAVDCRVIENSRAALLWEEIKEHRK